MNVWKTLGIVEGSDITTIKRAYVKLLKKTRPDEYPAEFQQLHTAYRQAIGLAEQRQRQNESDTSEYALSTLSVDIYNEQQNDCEIESSIAISSEWSEQTTVGHAGIQGTESTVHQDEGSARDSALEALIERVDDLLLDSEARCDIHRWRFLGNSSWLLEDDFNHKLGVDIFDRITGPSLVENRNESRQEKHCALPQEVLIFLDELFNWKYKCLYLISEFGEGRSGLVLNILDVEASINSAPGSVRGGKIIVSEKAFEGEQEQWVVEISLAKKMCAVVLDLALFSVVAFLVSQNFIFGFSQENVSFFDSYLH